MSQLYPISPRQDMFDMKLDTPRRTAIAFATPTNATSHLNWVRKLYEESVEQLHQYKQEKATLSIEIEKMKNDIINVNDDISKKLMAYILPLTNDMEVLIQSNVDENAKLMAQISEIKKEKSQIQELILRATEKLAEMEEQVGDYS